MKKKILAGLLTLCLVPFGVKADVKTVNSETELTNALADASVTEIVLGSDIETLGKINITKDVTIDGQNHSITYIGKFFNNENPEGTEDNTVWSKKSSNGVSGAVYVIQVYNSSVTLKDITLSGGNRGLGVNGGVATLEGTVNFTNNGFQDIELSVGKGNLDKHPTLVLSETANVRSDKNADEDLIVVQAPDADATGSYSVNATIISENGQKSIPATSGNEANWTLEEVKEEIGTVVLTFVYPTDEEDEPIEFYKNDSLTEDELEMFLAALEEELEAAGYKFLGFYADEDYTDEFDLTSPFTQDAKVYVKMEKIANEAEVVPPKTSDINMPVIIGMIMLAVAGAAFALRKRLAKVNR